MFAIVASLFPFSHKHKPVNSLIQLLLGHAKVWFRFQFRFSKQLLWLFDSNQTTIQEAIDGGFDNAPCNSCEASGGKCGLNTTNGDFICFCQDQPYAATTCSSSSKSGMFDIYTLQVEDSILIKIARKAEDSYDFNCFGCRFKFTISRRD